MSEFIQTESSIAEIMNRKRERSEALLHAISLASPSDLEAAAERIKKVMRESKGEQRRQRISPPVFSIK
jgi:DNA anti-recombination protein RmuC